MSDQTPHHFDNDEPSAVTELQVDVSHYQNVHSLGNRLARWLWGIVWLLLFRPSPKLFHAWRRWLLKLFGAKIGRGVHVYPSVKIWAPWNLRMDEHSCLAPNVDCYCVAPISIGAHSTVSQYSYLCTASHDFTRSALPLVTSPIVIEDQAWICADVFVGPGVTVGQGAVVGTRSNVTKDVEQWCVYAGNPARLIKKREMSDDNGA